MEVRQLLAGMLLLLGSLGALAQERETNSDYQYALIEAVKQKNLGNLAEAVKLYRLVIKEKPDCDVAYYELGGIYLMTKQVELSVQNLQKAFELSPENEWYTLAYLNALHAAQRYEEVEDILKQKMDMEPEQVEWEYQLANVYLSMEKGKKAIKTLERIEKERGYSDKVSLLKASVYEKDEEYDLALEELEKVMLVFPEAIQLRAVAADLCQKSGRKEEAAAYYREILEVDSTNTYALRNLTDYYLEKEEYGMSLYYLGKSFESSQIDVERKMSILAYYLGNDSYVQKYPELLEDALEVLIRVHPEAYDARLMASDFYIQGQDYGKAYWQLSAYIDGKGGTYPAYMQAILLANAASLNEELLGMSSLALESYPDSMDVRFFRGIALYELKDYQALISNFEGLDFDEFSNEDYAVQSQMLYAEALYRMEDFARSDSLFERMIEADPNNYTVLNNYSYYLAERGENLDRAEEWSQKAVKNNPENGTFLDTYAWVLYKKQEYEAAERFIMKALRFGGENDPEVNEHAGDILNALESKEIALSYYEKALVLGGDKTRLEEKIKVLKQEEKDD